MTEFGNVPLRDYLQLAVPDLRARLAQLLARGGATADDVLELLGDDVLEQHERRPRWFAQPLAGDDQHGPLLPPHVEQTSAEWLVDRLDAALQTAQLHLQQLDVLLRRCYVSMTVCGGRHDRVLDDLRRVLHPLPGVRPRLLARLWRRLTGRGRQR